LIQKSAIEEYLGRELENHVWMKKLARDVIMRELNSFKVKPYFKTDPFLHQLVCFYLGLIFPNFFYQLDMGTGKTKIALDLITHAQREKKLNHGLVFVPRLVNIDSWDKATRQHSDLGANLVTGCIEEKWERLIKPDGDISIVDYHGFQLAVSEKKQVKRKRKKVTELVRDESKIRQLKKIYNVFVNDETHKCANMESHRYGCVRAVTKDALMRYGLSGTVMGRDPMDIFTQFFLIDRGETFGTTKGMFQAAFFIEKPGFYGTEWEFDRKKHRKLYQMQQHRSIRYEEDECNDIPPRVEIQIPIQFAPEQKEAYLKAVEGLIAAGGEFRQIDSAFIRMRQITAGFLPWTDDDGAKHLIRFDENNKLEAMEALVEDAGDEKIIIFHEYTETGRLITNRLDQMKVKWVWLYGGSKDPIAIADKFRDDPEVRVLVANSESGGTGVDGLQSVCRYVLFYESPVEPRARKQAIKRAHRTGQTRRTYIYDLVMERSIDIRVLNSIADGENLFQSIVNGKENLKNLLF
jgi:superfamily II DNA or RNA helicase